MARNRCFIVCWIWCAALSLYAQSDGVVVDTAHIVRYTHLWGVGSVNLLDTYLSPLEYTGWQVSTLHASHRTLRRHPNLTLTARYGGNLSHSESPTADGKYWDVNLSAGIALRRKWDIGRRWTIEGGAMGELFLGGTYNQRNGNNPAQGRLGAQIGLSFQTSYGFTLWKKRFRVLADADIPLIGARFTPTYGQSYYEIFSLGHSDHNVRLTYFGNAPSMLFHALLELPLRRSAILIGYEAEVQQSHLAGLKHHNWGNRFVIGWTRRLALLKN